MCGIVGVLPKGKSGLFQTDCSMFSQMLFADQVRGTDGTGVIYNDKEGCKIIKSATDASTFMQKEIYNYALDKAAKEGHFLVGHNRAATKGSLLWKNTHPFHEGNIMLVHNGTLNDHKNLDKHLEVDSHAICRHMALYGAEETLEKIDGAFSLIWIDTQNLTINLARNYERPMTITDIGSAWLFSSEGGLAKWIAERNKKTVISSIEIETKKIYTFDINSPTSYTTKEVKFFVPKYNTNHQGWKQYYQKFSEEKFLPEENTGCNIVPFKGKDGNDVRRFGETVLCVPNPLPDMNDPLSAIIHDEKRNSNFVLCKILGEPDTEIRIYGKYKNLVRYCSADVLQGNVVSTTIKGKKVSYQLASITTHKSKTIQEANKENKEKHRHDGQAPNNNPNLDFCDFCKVLTPKVEMTIYHSSKLCPHCADLLEDNREFSANEVFGVWHKNGEGHC